MHDTRQRLQSPSTVGTNSVTSVAVRCPTVTATGESLPSGHCYLMLPPLMSVRDLVAAKVAAEFRKLRAAGPQQSSIGALLAEDAVAGHGPLDEQLATKAVLRQLRTGDVEIIIDAVPVQDPDEIFAVTRRTSIAFIVAAPVLA